MVGVIHFWCEEKEGTSGSYRDSRKKKKEKRTNNAEVLMGETLSIRKSANCNWGGVIANRTKGTGLYRPSPDMHGKRVAKTKLGHRVRYMKVRKKPANQREESPKKNGRPRRQKTGATGGLKAEAKTAGGRFPAKPKAGWKVVVCRIAFLEKTA